MNKNNEDSEKDSKVYGICFRGQTHYLIEKEKVIERLSKALEIITEH